jgi:hypothetical protein
VVEICLSCQTSVVRRRTGTNTRLHRGQLLVANAKMITESVLGAHVLRDMDVERLVEHFPIKTVSGRSHLLTQMSTPTADLAVLKERQAELRTVRRQFTSAKKEIDAVRSTLAECEDAVITVGSAAKDSRHAEYYNQILWAPGTWLSQFNPQGWLIELIVLFRTILLPGLAVLMPALLLIAPIFVFKFILKKELNFAEYMTMLRQSIQKAMPSVLGKPRFAGRGGPLEVGEQFIHLGATAAMFIASIWNQVSAALSMRRVVADMRSRADAVRRFTDATRRLGELLGVSVTLPAWTMTDMGLFGEAWNTPTNIQQLLDVAGRLDALVAVVACKRTCFVTYGDNIVLKDVYHPGTGAKRVYNSLTLGAGSRHHVMLTGPNRGGKSTILKAMGTAALMSQTLGIVFARKAVLPVFQHMITALNPTDILGHLSLFESEIEFAKDVRARVKDATGPIFLMMDEIFHGTNAHDGVEAATIFLDDLYAEKNVFSLISTHYMGLPERYGPKQTQNLCMDAAIDPANGDQLLYTYKLKEGVNGLSSVREILRERGLLVRSGSPKNVATGQ